MCLSLFIHCDFFQTQIAGSLDFLIILAVSFFSFLVSFLPFLTFLCLHLFSVLFLFFSLSVFSVFLISFMRNFFLSLFPFFLTPYSPLSSMPLLLRSFFPYWLHSFPLPIFLISYLLPCYFSILPCSLSVFPLSSLSSLFFCYSLFLTSSLIFEFVSLFQIQVNTFFLPIFLSYLVP